MQMRLFYGTWRFVHSFIFYFPSYSSFKTVQFDVLNMSNYSVYVIVFPFCQLKRVMESDAAMSEDLISYNIIPLDAPTLTNAIISLPEVKCFLFQLSFLLLLLYFFFRWINFWKLLTWLVFGILMLIFLYLWDKSRYERRCHHWTTSVTYQNCLAIFQYLPQETLTCLIFCITFLDFRSCIFLYWSTCCVRYSIEGFKVLVIATVVGSLWYLMLMSLLMWNISQPVDST